MDTCKHLVLPEGSNLHRLIARAMVAGKTRYNYLLAFKDVGGLGIQIAVVDWLPPGRTYTAGVRLEA